MRVRVHVGQGWNERVFESVCPSVCLSVTAPKQSCNLCVILSQLHSQSSPRLILSLPPDDSGEHQVKLTFTSVDGASLWSAAAAREMCAFDERLVRASPHVMTRGKDAPCASHSLGLYVGLMHNKTCENLTEEDMNQTLQVPKQTFKF